MHAKDNKEILFSLAKSKVIPGVAFETLLEQYRVPLYVHAKGLLNDNSTMAEDAVQQSLVRAWKGFPKFQGDSLQMFQSWLYRIATNVCSNIRRDEKEIAMGFPTDDAVDEDNGTHNGYVIQLDKEELNKSQLNGSEEHTQEKAEHILNIVERMVHSGALTVSQVRIFLERLINDTPVEEIAKREHIAEGTVKSRYSRTLEKVRRTV